MPPVEIANESGKNKKLKFIRNTAYNGKDYGPDAADGDTAEVDPRWAANFIASGHAVEVGGEKDKAKGGAGEDDETKKK